MKAIGSFSLTKDAQVTKDLLENNTKPKNGLKLSLLNRNCYKYKSLQSKSNEDLSSQNTTAERDLKCNTVNDPVSPPSSPSQDAWFKTWPECCEKTKSADSSPQHSNSNTHKNTLTLNEALQNISLAYSPVTKQLHVVDKEKCDPESMHCDEPNSLSKKGHKRIQAGSFSSTISNVSAWSNPSTTGSLLEIDDRDLICYEDHSGKTRKKSLTDFFTKNVFGWKTGNHDISNSSVWNLFSKPNTEHNGSPLHQVASSSALIQLKRPSNLPAKTAEEEHRHIEEYNEIVAAAKRKEAKNTVAKQKQQKIQLLLEEQQAASTKHFLHNVLPKWDKMSKTKKTKEMWWQGIPSSVRGKVWRLAIGNDLNITPQLYEICLTRAQARLNSPEPPRSDYGDDQESSMDVIELDISRTFPNLCIFQQGGPYSEVLHSLLAAYVSFRPDVGYLQGMSFIAAVLILNLEPCDAFICFANLLNRPLHLSAFTLDQTKMAAYYHAYDQVLNYNLPKLYGHFDKAGLTPDLYLLDWIYTVFAKAMPLDVACRVWDVFLRDGEEFIFRTALGILHLYQNNLSEMDFLHAAQFLTRLPDEICSDQLFKSIQSVTTSIGKQNFNQLVEKCMNNDRESQR